MKQSCQHFAVQCTCTPSVYLFLCQVEVNMKQSCQHFAVQCTCTPSVFMFLCQVEVNMKQSCQPFAVQCTCTPSVYLYSIFYLACTCRLFNSYFINLVTSPCFITFISGSRLNTSSHCISILEDTSRLECLYRFVNYSKIFSAFYSGGYKQILWLGK
jgi:hypothetical protein